MLTNILARGRRCPCRHRSQTIHCWSWIRKHRSRNRRQGKTGHRPRIQNQDPTHPSHW
jgi:hypothetical protein